MSKFRPTEKNAVYVIPDVHGRFELLQLILNRILPLRKSDGGLDRLIFLGDYIDRNVDSYKVVDCLIELKRVYGDRVQCLMGNHESMLMNAMNWVPGKEYSLQSQANAFDMWRSNGGLESIFGYFSRNGSAPENWVNATRSKVKELFSKQHIEFFQSLVKGYEWENWIFAHAQVGNADDDSPDGRNVIIGGDPETMCWSFDQTNFVKRAVQYNTPIPWNEKMVVVGHASQQDPVYVPGRFLMLDCGGRNKLIVAELRSMQAFMAEAGNKRMVQFDIKPTEKKKMMFKRVEPGKL